MPFAGPGVHRALRAADGTTIRLRSRHGRTPDIVAFGRMCVRERRPASGTTWAPYCRWEPERRGMNEISLKLARLGDAPAIANMSHALVEAGLPWNWTPRRVAELIRQRECLAVVAWAQRRLAGFVLTQFSDEAAHIALLCVAEEYRRQGIARRLVQWVEESAVAAGVFQVRLETRRINRGAQRFYASLGYTSSGVLCGYYSGIEDAIRLSRDLRIAPRDPKRVNR